MTTSSPFRVLLLSPYDEPIDEFALCRAQNGSVSEELLKLRNSVFGAFDRRGRESLGLGSIAAVLREAGFEVRLIDCAAQRFGVNAAAYAIQQYRPNWIGIGISSPLQSQAAGEIIAAVRQRGVTAHVSAGGVFTTANFTRLLGYLPQIDSAIVGEGEISALDLVRALQRGSEWQNTSGLAFRANGVIEWNRPMRAADLDSLPFPSRDTLDAIAGMNQPIAGIDVFATRQYVFPYESCSTAELRHRSPARVVEELTGLASRFGVRRFHFVDPDFTAWGAHRIREFACRLLDSKLKLDFSVEAICTRIEKDDLQLLRRAGLSRITLALGSASPLALKRRNSGYTLDVIERCLRSCEETGAEADPWMVLFDTGSTLEELLENIAFLRRSAIDRWPRPACLLNRLEFSPALDPASALRYDPADTGWQPFVSAFRNPEMGVVWKILRTFSVRLQENCEGYVPVLAARAWRKFRVDRSDSSSRQMLAATRAWRQHAGGLFLSFLEICANMLQSCGGNIDRLESDLRDALRAAEREFDQKWLGTQVQHAAMVYA